MRLIVTNIGRARVHLLPRGANSERSSTGSVEPGLVGTYQTARDMRVVAIESSDSAEQIDILVANDGQKSLRISEEGQGLELAGPMTLAPGESRAYEGSAGVIAVVEEIETETADTEE